MKTPAVQFLALGLIAMAGTGASEVKDVVKRACGFANIAAGAD
ncbi:MAG: hypothetical protein ACLQAR_06725 [Steroidobacteraceae bacterium]